MSDQVEEEPTLYTWDKATEQFEDLKPLEFGVASRRADLIEALKFHFDYDYTSDDGKALYSVYKAAGLL